MVTARLAETEGAWRLELDGRPVELAVPKLDRPDPESERLDPRHVAIHAAEWCLLDRGWRPVGGWTWDEGVGQVGLAPSEPEEPTAAEVGQVLGEVLDLVDESVARISDHHVATMLMLTLEGVPTPFPRFGLRVLRETPAHVTFQLSSATGGQWLGGVGQMTMAVAEFRVFRLLLAPLLTDRPDPH